MGHTSVHMAAHRNGTEAVNMLTLLLGLGGEVNCAGFGGQTPLMESVYNGNVEAVKLLVTAGADVNAVNTQGATTLHLVARGSQASIDKRTARADIVCLLLKAGVDPSLRDSKERTALEESIIHEGFDSEVAKILIKVSPPPQFKKKKKSKQNKDKSRLSMLTLKPKNVTDEILIATLKEQTRDMTLTRATTAMISEKALEEKLWKAVDGIRERGTYHTCITYPFSHVPDLIPYPLSCTFI